MGKFDLQCASGLGIYETAKKKRGEMGFCPSLAYEGQTTWHSLPVTSIHLTFDRLWHWQRPTIYWHCTSDIPHPLSGSGIWVGNRGSGIFSLHKFPNHFSRPPIPDPNSRPEEGVGNVRCAMPLTEKQKQYLERTNRKNKATSLI